MDIERIEFEGAGVTIVAVIFDYFKRHVPAWDAGAPRGRDVR